MLTATNTAAVVWRVRRETNFAASRASVFILSKMANASSVVAIPQPQPVAQTNTQPTAPTPPLRDRA